ncbi:hypothetical protein PUMCH_003077 [Australozyma saopauloensis]|uniref:Thioesterase domain-containing protein n=1 Tax=Australozyma saopauloensis TaxID=291208 RepID=A0AAX4HB49_9ASCO|nr:hypothetical protein PUMCH_003077 [[Candida] saopauloensis]
MAGTPILLPVFQTTTPMNFLRTVTRRTSPLVAFGLGLVLFPAEWRRGNWESRKISSINDSAMNQIQNSPLYQQLSADEDVKKQNVSESFPTQHHKNHIGSGILFGPDLFEIDPVLFINDREGELTGFYHLGKRLISQDGLIHNGVTATILDEGLCRCGFSQLPSKKGVTANLNIDFHNQAPPDSTVVLRARVKSAKGRKVVITGELTTLATEGTEPINIASASCILVEPRWFRYLGWLGI